jgi:hypothetical protein
MQIAQLGAPRAEGYGIALVAHSGGTARSPISGRFTAGHVSGCWPNYPEATRAAR